jgi:hypothetical protein
MSNNVRPNDKFYTDLDRQLQDLAACDWPAFVRLIGEENVTTAKVCLLKAKGKSIRGIAIRLAVAKHQAEYDCKKCPNNSDTSN